MGFQRDHPIPPPVFRPGGPQTVQRKSSLVAVPPVFVPARGLPPRVPLAVAQRKAALHPMPPVPAAMTLQARMPVAPPRRPILQRASNFSAHGISFANPGNYAFTGASALAATQPIPRGEAKEATGRSADSGVGVGDVGSYAHVQYLEKVGDGLTGDHQPSGAAVKEAVREMLHTALSKPLTRSMARNAYQKAITVVMTDVWHKLYSRTYGGRNSKAKIVSDASDLAAAAIKDWMTTVTGLQAEGLTDDEIEDIWDNLNAAREEFFATGLAQAGSL